MLPPNVTDVKGFLLRNCNKSLFGLKDGGGWYKYRPQRKFLPRGTGEELTRCGGPPGGKTRRVQKPSVFIRFDAHVAKAGINIRGCAPLSTPINKGGCLVKRYLIPTKKIGSEGRGPPAGGQFRRVSRGGTSSVVDTYTGLSHFFKALAAKIAIQTLGRLSTKNSISIIISTSIVHRASGGQHTIRKEV